MRLTRSLLQRMREEAESAYEDARDKVRIEEKTWIRRLAFYRGWQYLISAEDDEYVGRDPNGEEREVFNEIRRTVRTMVSSQVRQLPKPEVPAARGDHRARARAEATESLLQSFVDNNVFNIEELIRCVLFAKIVGGGYIKHTWDRRGGKLNPDWTDLVDDGFGNQGPRLIPEGEIKMEFVDPFHCLRDPSALKFDECRYICHEKIRPVAELEQRFKKDVFGKSTKGRWDRRDHDDIEATALSGVDEYSYSAFSSGQRLEGNYLSRYVEYWEKPTEEFQMGRLIVFSGAMLLYAGSIPYFPPRLPFVLYYGDALNPMGYFADGIEDLIGPQETMNLLLSSLKEWVSKILRPHILNPIGSHVESDLFDDVGGQTIDYTKGFEPDFMVPPDIPNGMFGMHATLTNQIRDLSGYGEPGSPAENVRSGRQHAFVEEDLRAAQVPDDLIFTRNVLESFKQEILLAHQYYDDGKMIRVLGPEGKYERIAFKEEDYDWDADLAPEAFGDAPRSRSQRMQEILDLHREDVLNPENPSGGVALKLLGYDVQVAKLKQPNDEDITKARRDITIIITAARTGETPMLNPREFDVAGIHIDIKNGFRKTVEYDELPPMYQAILDSNVEWYEGLHRAQLGLQAEDSQFEGGGGPAGAPMAPPPPGAGPPGSQPMQPPESQAEFLNSPEAQQLLPSQQKPAA